MASGSFNIDTFSYRYQLPLSNGYTAYSTGTMFAVGVSSFLNGYTFYDYSYGLCGFPDTSTMSVNITNLISSQSVSITRLISTTFSTTMNNFSNIRNYISTDASLTRTFNYILPSASTFISSQTLPTIDYPLVINGPTLDLKTAYLTNGVSIFDFLRMHTHDVFIQFNYSIVLNKPGEDFSWISTLAYFDQFNFFNLDYRRQYTSRVGLNSNYTTLTPYFKFRNDDTISIPLNASTLSFKFVCASNTPISTQAPSFNIYVPGENNYTFTFYPFLSNIQYAPGPLATQNIR